jgi:hypothetical protein
MALEMLFAFYEARFLIFKLGKTVCVRIGDNIPGLSKLLKEPELLLFLNMGNSFMLIVSNIIAQL